MDVPRFPAVTTTSFSTQSLSSLVLYGVNSTDDGLSVIDPVTGAVTLIGPLDPVSSSYATPVALAVRPADQRLFVWNNSPNSQLLTVDPCTGRATVVNPAAPAQPFATALAFAPNGRLYAVDVVLTEIDPATGISSLIGPVGFRAGAADFNAAGLLYVVELSLSSDRLGIVDLSTGTATVIDTLQHDVGTIGSIVFDPSGKLIGSAFGGPFGNILFDIDPATAAVTNIRPVAGNAPQGLGFAPACDAPTTLPVAIDVRPDARNNEILCTNPNFVITTAVLTTGAFNAATVAHESLRLDGGREIHRRADGTAVLHVDDVDRDGDLDMLLHVRLGSTSLDCSSVEATLTGHTLAAQAIEGRDALVMLRGAAVQQ